jgi:hypothetical protein
MSSNLSVTACNRKVDKIQLIYDFLMKHESGEFKEFAELIKKENNINAKNINGKKDLHQDMCWTLLTFLLTASLADQINIGEYSLYLEPYVNASRKYGVTALHLGEKY